ADPVGADAGLRAGQRLQRLDARIVDAAQPGERVVAVPGPARADGQRDVAARAGRLPGVEQAAPRRRAGVVARLPAGAGLAASGLAAGRLAADRNQQERTRGSIHRASWGYWLAWRIRASASLRRIPAGKRSR